MNNKDDFKFFVPFEIEKAKDAQGNEVMKIAGIASTIDRDSDGEVLDPSGFDLSYFLNNGFINWHHQSKDKPEAIIGEPTKAEIRKEGLYVEGVLYPESKLAKQVYDLAKGLEKSSKKRRLGFSIEGKVMERDSLDERFVKKAKITGLAVTPTPKNSNTIVDIIKGNFSSFDDEDILSNESSSANGGNILILDVIKPNGDRIIVDSKYNIKVLSKSTDTGSAGILSPASVDEDLKNLENSSENEEKNDMKTEKNSKFVLLNKSEIFVELLKSTDNSELTKSIIDKINFTNMSKPTVSIEQLQKALSDIGVEVDAELLKGENQDFEAQVKESEKDKAKQKEVSSTDKEEDNENEDEKIEKAISDKEAELEILKAQKEELAKSKKEKISEEDKDKKDVSAEEINAEVDKKLGSVEKGLKDEFEKGQQTILSKVEELFKGFSERVEERLSTIESQPGQRKSASSAKYIEKAFGGAEEKQNENKTVLSVSQQRQQVSNILLAKSGIEKGETNEFYANAMMQFEATGEISKAVITDLYTNSNILVTQ